jgi:hypothetical protein
MGLNGVYPYYPSYIYSIANGKVYTLTGEHSPNVPLYTNGQTRCVDAYTGKEIWTLTGWGGYPSRTGAAMADGFFVYFNCYDSQLYCIGKGTSATTVEAPMTAVSAGTSVIIRGTVTDQSPGAKAKGTAAVSDSSMKVWMEYMYMQKTKPKDATGVNVTIDAIDPNGNLIHIGDAKSDTSGLYSYMWKTPNVPGKYTITATFKGTESYWQSSAETAMGVDPAAAVSAAIETPTPIVTSNPTPVQPASPSPSAVVIPPTSESATTTYVAIGAAVIIVVAAAAALILRRRK